MDRYEVELIFSVGDVETVAKFTIEREAAGHAAAIEVALNELDTGKGFTRDDLLQALVTKQNHGVAPNLLY